MTQENYFFLHGAPGDVMCAMGNALKHPGFIAPANFFVYCNDPAVVRFIEAQKFTGRVVHCAPASPEEYRRSVMELCIKPNEHKNPMLFHLARRAGLHREHGINLVCCHIGNQIREIENDPVHWKSRDLPPDAIPWAESVIRRDGKPNILVNPFSFQSNSLDRHWPHWPLFLDWLQEHPLFNVYLTGLGWRSPHKAGHIIPLQNQCPTFYHLLALATLCDGSITTNNNLSHWSVIADLPVINVLNAVGTRPESYFIKWIRFDKAQVVQFHDPLQALIQKVESGWPFNIEVRRERSELT